jgi:hypothetical protein
MSYAKVLAGLGLALTGLAFVPSAAAQAAAPATTTAQPTFCAVEIGSRGIKGRLFTFASSGGNDRRSVDIAYQRDINTNIVGSMQGNNFSAKGIEEAVNATATMMAEMRATNAQCQPFVVGSSGVARAGNRDDLSQAVIAKVGVQQFEFVSAEQEALYGFLGTVPRKDWENTLFVDIGSGNIKLATLKGKDLTTIEVPHGVTTFTRKTTDMGGDIFAAIDRAIDGEVRPALKSAIGGKPIVMARRNVVMIGGTVWAMATYLYPDKARRKVVRFGDSDFSQFRASLQDRSYVNAKIGAFSSKMTRDTFERDLRAASETFTRDNLAAGTSLLKMVLDERQGSGPVYFARQGNWLYGYVQEKFAAELWGNGGIEDHM